MRNQSYYRYRFKTHPKDAGTLRKDGNRRPPYRNLAVIMLDGCGCVNCSKAIPARKTQARPTAARAAPISSSGSALPARKKQARPTRHPSVQPLPTASGTSASATTSARRMAEFARARYAVQYVGTSTLQPCAPHQVFQQRGVVPLCWRVEAVALRAPRADMHVQGHHAAAAVGLLDCAPLSSPRRRSPAGTT